MDPRSEVASGIIAFGGPELANSVRFLSAGLLAVARNVLSGALSVPWVKCKKTLLACRGFVVNLLPAMKNG